MIGRLTGTILDRTLEGACLIDVNGVGYEVYVPLGALGRLPEAPAMATLHVHTHVREDVFMLYGFASLSDRAAFRALLGVNGIGPRLALAILSAMSAAELADALSRGDKARFKGVSGVGAKLVERLVLELKGKLDFARGEPALPVPKSKAPPGFAGTLGTVHAALVQLGFRAQEAEHALEKVGAQADGKAPEQLLREAPAVLS